MPRVSSSFIHQIYRLRLFVFIIAIHCCQDIYTNTQNTNTRMRNLLPHSRHKKEIKLHYIRARYTNRQQQIKINFVALLLKLALYFVSSHLHICTRGVKKSTAIKSELWARLLFLFLTFFMHTLPISAEKYHYITL